MKKRDIAFICAILALAGLIFALFALIQGSGDYVLIRIDGREIAKYSLSEDGEYILGDGISTLKISNGKASLHGSRCPDKLCQRRGEVYRDGEVITCLPNKLTVTVYSAEGDIELVG